MTFLERLEAIATALTSIATNAPLAVTQLTALSTFLDNLDTTP